MPTMGIKGNPGYIEKSNFQELLGWALLLLSLTYN